MAGQVSWIPQTSKPECFQTLQCFFTDGDQDSMAKGSQAQMDEFDDLMAKFLYGAKKLRMVKIRVMKPRLSHVTALAESHQTLWSLELCSMVSDSALSETNCLDLLVINLPATGLPRLQIATLDIPNAIPGSPYSAFFESLSLYRSLRRLRFCGEKTLLIHLESTISLPLPNPLIGKYVKKMKKSLFKRKQGVALEETVFDLSGDFESGKTHDCVPNLELDLL